MRTRAGRAVAAGTVRVGFALLVAAVPLSLVALVALVGTTCAGVGDCYGSGFEAPALIAAVLLIGAVSIGVSELFDPDQPAVSRRSLRLTGWGLLMLSIPVGVLAAAAASVLLGAGSGDYLVMGLVALAYGLVVVLTLAVTGACLLIRSRRHSEKKPAFPERTRPRH
jgi:hypothetical protein